MKLKTLWTFLRETVENFLADNAMTLGAALAYYTIFSLAPLLLVVIAIAGLVFGRQAVEGQIVNQISGLVGRQGGQAVQTMVANAAHTGSGVFATVAAVVTTLVGASGVFVQLQSSLNQIWEVRPKPQGIKGFMRARALSFGVLLGIGFLLLVSLVVSAGLAALGGYTHSLGPIAYVVLTVVNFFVSFAVITLLFALMFRILPDVEIAWRDVWAGAIGTALLFTVGKHLIGLYLGNSSIASVYGAAGSLVVVLVWIYYSTQILLLGAELTKVYAAHRGARIRPSANAVPAPAPDPITTQTRPREELAARSDQPAASGRPDPARVPSPGLKSKTPARQGGAPGSAEKRESKR
jgi:membrane protein